MGEHTSQDKQTTPAKNTMEATHARTPIAMSTGDHTILVDLLLQQAAQSARTVAAITDPQQLLRASGQAVARARAALASYAVPETGTADQRLFPAVDGAFMALYDLYFLVQSQQDPTVSGYAPEIQGALVEINDRFAPLGWKVPKSDIEGHARAKISDKVGATTLTSAEKGQLGRMHMRAARQYLVGGWDEIAEGKIGAVTIAAHNVADAMSILVDPHFADQIDIIADEVAATEQVFGRLVMVVEQRDAAKLGELRELAQHLDAMLRLVGRDAHWVARIAAPSPATAGSASAAAMQGGTLPSASAQGSATASTANNDVDRGAPRAEPAMHRIGETRHWTKKVHLKDTNYIDEYLGYIELFIEAYKTPSGQIYVQRAKATKKLEGRAGEYLSMGADVVANSVELKGQRFCDVYFDIQIGGPNKTETTGVAAGVKASASSEDKTVGAEASASVTFSTAVSSQGTRAFRRVYRISSLGKPVPIIQFDENDPYHPKIVDSGMEESERTDLHQDFEDFELDDDDVGDTLTTFYANWIVHSYSD